MKWAIFIFGILAFGAGIFLLTSALDQILNYVFILFLITGFVAIGAAIKYTIGKNPFGYKGYGDLMVFIFFGLAAVSGTHFLHSLHINGLVLLPAMAIGLLSAGVLNVNNMRDIVNDATSGKITLAVKMGPKGSKMYHIALVMISIVLLSLFLILQGKILVFYTLALPVLPLIYHCYKIISTKDPQNLDPELKRLSLSTLFISLWVGIGLIL